MSLLFWLDLFRWLFSRTFRKAGELGDTVQKILDHQRDVLPGANIATVEAALAALKKVVRSGADAAAIKAQMASLEEEANRWLRPYPNADFREYAVMFLEIAILIPVDDRHGAGIIIVVDSQQGGGLGKAAAL